MNKAFTIIELLVVSAIIALLTGLLFPNWRAGQNQFAVQRAAHKLAQDIRRTQEMALASQQLPSGQVPYAYGVYFRKSEPKHYIIFADLNNDNDYTPTTDAVIEDIAIERKAAITELSADPLRIAFRPPRPTIAVLPASPAFVRLVSEGGGVQEEVCVNNLGLIEVAKTCGSVNSPPTANSCSVSCVAGSSGCIASAKVSAGVNVTFTLSGSAKDTDGSIVAYCWEWGDGTSEPCSSLNPISRSHTYGVGGTYYPRLYVKDDDGAASGKKTCNAIEVVAVPPGNLVGYAWSENVGWIDFCPTPLAPGPVGNHAGCAEIAGSELRGWARQVGTGHWISLNCVDDPSCTSGYKVVYNSSTKKFSGWAWSENFGWICFSSETCGGTIPFSVTYNPNTNELEGWAWSEHIGWISFNCKDTSTCGTSNYKVKHQ